MTVRKDAVACTIVKRLVAAGYIAYYAGGRVRDMLLGNVGDNDIDIATSAIPSQVVALFRNTVGIGEHFGVILVVEEGLPFEVATFRQDVGATDGRHPDSIVASDPRGDAQRRDFTINGMFYDPLTDKLIDFVDGRADLTKKIIRAIGDPMARFSEDYLRVLRAIRFAARFDFAIEPTTWDALTRSVDGLSVVSSERVFQEIDKMVRGPNPHIALELLNQAGLLERVLPEVKALAGVEQPPEFHPEGDVLRHTELALSLLDAPSQVTAWSALLHDIGKPATMTRSDRIRFNNHSRVGANMAMHVLKRLKSSRALAEAVYDCIDNHMNFINLKSMRLGTLKKFLARPTIEDEIELHRVDCLASHGDLENVAFLRDAQSKLAVEVIRPEPLLRGRDLIEMGFKPGKNFGAILDAVYDLQLDETLKTADEARQWVKEHRGEFDPQVNV
jgi:putative nucleotidyltransferase with HDIG domain